MQATESWPASETAIVAIAELRTYAQNPMVHTDDQVEKIEASIREFGFTIPILVDEDRLIIAGHGRLMAAQRIGLTHVPIIVARGWTDAQKRSYRILDNQLPRLASFSADMMRLEIADLTLAGFNLDLLGFDDTQLKAWGAPIADEPERDPDALPPTPKAPITRPGDLWVMGSHRLVCASNDDREAIGRLMGDERATLVFTSPPYSNQRDYTTKGVSDWDKLMQGACGSLPVVDSAQILVNLGLVHRGGEWLPYWESWIEWMRTQGWRRFGIYVWDQGAGLPGDWTGRMAPSFEFIFHFNKMNRKPNKIVPCKLAGGSRGGGGGLREKSGVVEREWTHGDRPVQDMRIPDSVVRIQRHQGGIGMDVTHPAVFPVALPEFVMSAYSDKGHVVYEPFCGAGSSILAAEKIGHRCFGVELAPAYCDMAVARWERLTGRKAEREIARSANPPRKPRRKRPDTQPNAAAS